MMRDRRLMDMHCSFGPPRCPAGEMNKRHVLGSGWYNVI